MSGQVITGEWQWVKLKGQPTAHLVRANDLNGMPESLCGGVLPLRRRLVDRSAGDPLQFPIPCAKCKRRDAAQSQELSS